MATRPRKRKFGRNVETFSWISNLKVARWKLLVKHRFRIWPKIAKASVLSQSARIRFPVFLTEDIRFARDFPVGWLRRDPPIRLVQPPHAWCNRRLYGGTTTLLYRFTLPQEDLDGPFCLVT